MTRRWLGDENPVASLGELKLLLLGVRGAVPLALESGTELGEGREVLGAVGGGLAADDVLQGRDRDVQTFAERLLLSSRWRSS